MKIYAEHSSINIGDFFYQEAIFLILKDLFKKHEIKYFDAPIQRSFKVNNNFYSKNAFDLRNFIDGDLYILSGPILGKKFVSDYGELIKKIKSEKKEYLILSAFGHDIPEIKSFFKNFRHLECRLDQKIHSIFIINFHKTLTMEYVTLFFYLCIQVLQILFIKIILLKVFIQLLKLK